MTFEEYQRIPAINGSSLKAGQISMKHMRAEMTKAIEKDSPSLRYGRLVHKAVLEPVAFKSLACVFEGDKVKNKNAWMEFKECHDPQWIITADERDEFHAISRAVKSHPDALRLIDGCVTELTVEWNDEEYGAGKARLDGWHEQHGVIELKTTRHIAPIPFGRQFVSLFYDISAGWYSHGVQASKLCADVPAYTVIAIENDEPFDVAVYQVPRMVIDIGYKRAAKTAREYRSCEACEVYPGVQELAQELVVPDWWGEEDIMSNFFESAKEGLGVE